MNLHNVRERFESRVAGIEKETSYLLGKLALVIDAQRIAVEIGDGGPASTEFHAEPTGSISQTVTALPASEIEPAAATTPESVEEPASYSNVAQFTPAAMAEEVGAEEARVEEAVADPVDAAAEAQAECEQEASLQTTSEPVAVIEEEALAPWQVNADDDSLEDTAILEKLANSEAGETDADEAADSDAQNDAIASVRKKLAAAAAEGNTKSPSLTLAETSAQPAVDAEEEALAPEEAKADDDPLEDMADSDAQNDAIASVRKKLASAAAEKNTKSSFLTLGKFLNRAN